ncbi:nucleotide-diphospho-sugar transferase [Hyaloraphidium curvatum]|nr:nucleotide-diphospho-sugar transferase [Hyaloraphidium curvatum]
MATSPLLTSPDIPATSNRRKAVLLVGGNSIGTRFRPLSFTTPKPLFPIAGLPMIRHHVDALAQVEGMRDILLIGFYENGVFDRFLSEVTLDFPGINFRYLREYVSLGTGGGLHHFRDEVLRGNPDYVFVLHADIASSFPLSDMLEFHRSHGKPFTIMGTKVSKESVRRYGSLVADPQTNEVLHYVEKPETFISDIISCGVYIFDRSIFRDMAKAVAERRARYEKELEDDSFTYGSLSSAEVDAVQLENDVIQKLAGTGRLYVYPIGPNDFWMQIKAAASALPANALYLQYWAKTAPHRLARKPSTFALAHMAAALPNQTRPHMFGAARENGGSVTVGGPPVLATHSPSQLTPESPEPGYINPPAEAPQAPVSPVRKARTEPEIIQPVIIHPSAIVHPTAKIGPNVSLAERVVVGRGVRIHNSIILDNVEIKHDSIVLNSIVGKDCRIGCWARVEGGHIDVHAAAASGGATVNNAKAPGATVLGTEVKVADEVVIRNCIVLPHKELKGYACSSIPLIRI